MKKNLLHKSGFFHPPSLWQSLVENQKPWAENPWNRLLLGGQFSALELFSCLLVWKTENLKTVELTIVHLVTAYFKDFQLKVFYFLLEIESEGGLEKPLLCNKWTFQAEQLRKWLLLSLEMTTLTILSEIAVILCICSACNNRYFFLSLR